MATHSKIGASSMSRWSKCPGSVRLSKDIPPQTSSYAEEGTLAHEFAEKWLRNQKVDTACDPTMVSHIQVYVKTIHDDLDEITDRGGGFNIFIEHKFNLEKLHPGLFGTADCVVYDDSKRLLRVYDLKYGAGVPVECTGNVQLQYYALGALLTTKFIPTDVEMVVVQPRCEHPDGPVRRWRVDSMDMVDFAADLMEAAKRTEKEDAPLIAGKHCRFCPAAGTCPELANQAQLAAKEEFSPTLTYDPEKLGEALTKLPLLEIHIKAMREFAYNEVERGRPIPGWKLVDKRATRKWIDEEDAKVKLFHAAKLSSDELHEHKFKSPAQIEKVLPKNLKKILEDLTVKESSGKTLVPEDDNRKLTNTAKIDFEGN